MKEKNGCSQVPEQPQFAHRADAGTPREGPEVEPHPLGAENECANSLRLSRIVQGQPESELF
jgi:hypothetical protein